MIKFTEKQLKFLKDLVAEFGTENETKEHRKYSEFYYSTYYTIKEEDSVDFEDEDLFNKVRGLTVNICGYWDDSYGLEITDLSLSLDESEPNPDYTLLETVFKESKIPVPEEVTKHVINSFPKLKYKITPVKYWVEG